jgi:hypothetical protein
MVGFLVLAATPALAAEGAHGKGSWEVTLTSDFDQGFSPSIGYYIADNLALTVQATHSQNEIDVAGATTDITHTALGAGLVFNVPTGGPVVPFVGVLLQYAREEDDAPGVINDLELSGPAIEVEGGVKFMVNERSSVNILLSYLTGTLESTVGGATGPDADVTDVSLGLGYSLYFQ